MRAHGTTVLYVFHEPESIWNLFAEGWRQIVRFPFSAICSIAMLRIASGVLVPSTHARALYERHYLRHNPAVFTMPLVFEDEIGPSAFEEARRNKRFFGFIGSASKGHGIGEFVSFAKYAIRNGSTIPFVIATRRSMCRLLARDVELSRYVDEGKILVHHGRILSNGEINQWYLESFCVWNVYRRSTQSGVLPRAFMAGTPVLARRIGSFPEYVRAQETGEFVDSGVDLAALLRVAEEIRGRCGSYAGPCRETFLSKFHYRANSARLAEILDQIHTRKKAKLHLAL
jgi:glycosyltransferase involved in cell wall biosynthesis